jgi:hypothetical protein
MPVRRNQPAKTTAADIAGDLPERFYNPVVAVEHGAMTGLRDYLTDLQAHLDKTHGQSRPGLPCAVEIMEELGIPPSEWYRAALAAQTENSRRTASGQPAQPETTA